MMSHVNLRGERLAVDLRTGLLEKVDRGPRIVGHAHFLSTSRVFS